MRQLAWIAATFVLALGGAAATVGGPTEPARVRNCVVEGHLPEQPGVAEQGGYRFTYQTLRGVTEDRRACTAHRLANSDGRAPTPVRWTLGEVVVVDKVRLPRCEGDGCDWLDVVRYFPGEVDSNLSELAYGLNADAYRETAETFMTTVGPADAEAAAARGIAASSVGTEIAGVVATRDGASVALHLIAKSRFEPDPRGGARLVYEVTDLSGDGWGGGELRVEWDAWSAIGVDAWSAAGAAAGGAPGATVEVVVHARTFALDERLQLRVYGRGDGEPLAVVSMPAYVAGDAAP